MKVYIVTEGSYSEYHIEAVFSTRKAAENYANNRYISENDDYEIEEYVMDDISQGKKAEYVKITYGIGSNQVLSLEPKEKSEPDKISDHCNSFTCCIHADAIKERPIPKEIALKIAQDRWAEYRYEHEAEFDKLVKPIIYRCPYCNTHTTNLLCKKCLAMLPGDSKPLTLNDLLKERGTKHE